MPCTALQIFLLKFKNLHLNQILKRKYFAELSLYRCIDSLCTIFHVTCIPLLLHIKFAYVQRSEARTHRRYSLFLDAVIDFAENRR